ncbi:MAG: aspartate-semialdehyde dehydrogenase [Candidatus Omnitrophica bacterium]|jgi:aspartate-semialdehyde dehydrogenase|nr:aspartate-semialdehyde dehydrogenase [Candidatus Omnitrophota bacterium]MCF7877675.1 aspartate-semialdehyde dehydrogenase [Candidatus Omnitrophota bacterium]MCF7895591.1 aspartate-semialdehyde dehydrogenase [Candidatus Omnitrophota bacterium]MCF7897889.1 aspartate-semialdehyde dehydrogenase [Candidatus Omnitrophota bacterium]MCF7909107.1 aspartate-semialdehyde dehydrogenase [Candidatus Omnitrophota bacterium]
MGKNVAVVGVGAVGIEILKILKERNFPADRIRVFARTKREIKIGRDSYQVEAISDQNFDNINIAFFAGTEGAKGASVQYAHKFIEKGAVVIDNGKDFRLKPDVPLVVPEINKSDIDKNKGLIANPNCTTIQMVVALGGVFKRFGLERIVMTSLQATSGGGRASAQSLWEETKYIVEKNKDKKYFNQLDKDRNGTESSFTDQIAFNALPQIGSFNQDGFTSEEQKVVDESHKIYGDNKIKISSTCVRVPVFTSHSESIYFKTVQPASLEEIRKVLVDSQGVNFSESNSQLPLALGAEGSDLVHLGRLRADSSEKNCFWIWAVADNLRKGAALNAVQIAENL